MRPALPHPSRPKRTTRPLQLLHADVVGRIHPDSEPGCNSWLLTQLDDYSGHSWALPMSSKGEAAPVLARLLRLLQRQLQLPVLALRTDRGREFLGDLQPFLAEQGIQHELSAPHEHQ